jgi:hypothetical protein
LVKRGYYTISFLKSSFFGYSFVFFISLSIIKKRGES